MNKKIKKESSNINRRKFLKVSSIMGIGIFGANNVAKALIQCRPFYNSVFGPVQNCVAGIRGDLAPVGTQASSQWCWAACIEMVFRYYGFIISQESIVKQTWGDIINLPGYSNQILANLNGVWKDYNGREFKVSGDSYTINIQKASQDLIHNMPLIVGTRGHVMVLTELKYVRDNYGNVVSTNEAIVIDPWPGKGVRALTPQEWYEINLLIRIRVQRIF